MKLTYILMAFALAFMFGACGNTAETESTTADSAVCCATKVEPTAIENFDTFYTKFIDDKTFQAERTQFPMKGGVYEEEGVTEWTKDNWKPITKNINTYNKNEFQVEVIETETKVEHKMGLKNSGMGGSMAFELIDNQWYLTEYQISNF